MPYWSLPCLLAAVSVAPVQAQEPVTAFVNVAVIPMDSARVLPGQTVVVRGARIVALGPAKQVPVPAGAVRIDGQGKFLLPGLADMHVHIFPAPDFAKRASFNARDWAEAERVLFLYVATGVTTIRTMGFSFGSELLTLRTRAATGELLSPRLYVAAGPSSRPPDVLVQQVEAAKAAGYDLFKMYGQNGQQFDSLVAAARRVGLPIAGHIPSKADGGGYLGYENELEQAVQAGYTSIEHLEGFLDGSAGGELLVDSARVPVMAAAMRRAGVWSCPTLMILGSNAGYFNADTLGSWPELRYLADTARRQLLAEMAEMAQLPPNVSPVDIARWMTVRRRVVKALRDAGVGLLLGTDAPASTSLIPGFSVHRELVELVQAGLTPYEALATGTRNVAAYFGTLDSTGTVAVGKRADLILLTGNPLTDIHQTMHRAGVMIGGRWLPRSELDARLKALEGTLVLSRSSD